eukprot:PhM_4_TR640/c0_g1_i1/m.18751
MLVKVLEGLVKEETASLALDDRGEHDRDDGHELDENVQGGARGVLERIANGVTDDSGLVDGGALAGPGNAAGFNVLLGVVPGATSVGAGDGHLHTGDEGTGEETGESLLAKEDARQDGREDDEAAGGDHLLEGGDRGDVDARLVVGVGVALLEPGDLVELTTDLDDHLHGSLADALHCQGGEPVREHGANEETAHDAGVNHGDTGDVSTVGDAREEGTVQGEADEGGTADGEALADGGCRVTGSVEGVSDGADLLAHLGHLGDATGVVADGAVGIDREADGHRGENAEGGEGEAVQEAEVVRDVDRNGHGEAGDEHGHVAESETVDDVRGGTGVGRVSDLARGQVAARRVVVGNVADD